MSDLTVGRYRFETDSRHANRNGYVHGGLLMTIADHGMGLAARQGDRALIHATVSFTMQFVAAVRPGALIELNCRIVQARRSMIFIDGEMRSDNEIAAICSGVWKRFTPPE